MTTRTFIQARTALLVLAVIGAFAATPARVVAQSLSAPTFLNQSNPDELVAGSPTSPSLERESGTAIVSSGAGTFVTQYFSLVTADGDGAASSGVLEPLTSDYTVSFTVSAPGAYTLAVDTQLSGDLHLVNDDANGATADVSPVSGTQMGGTITSGSLSLADPGTASGSLGTSTPFSQTGAATIFGVSNAGVVAHSLRFTFLQTASTDTSGGDEAAVRLGGTSGVSSETAGDYPGTPARTQADDGHFVTVTLTSLCGNGVIDVGPAYAEDCDDGAQTGQPGSCCNADCTFVADDDPCDDGDACTSGEVCTSGVCGGGDEQGCPLCQTCDANNGCVDGPRPICKLTTVPLKAKLQIKDSTTTDASDLVQFKWVKGVATSTEDFGDPVNTDDYGLCVFAPGLALKMIAPAGGACGTKACWKVLSIKGFSYKDPERTPNGVDKVSLKAGVPGKAKTQLKGKGDNLPALPLPLGLPATVQLQSAEGECWEATFSSQGMIQNDMTQFKGKND